MSELSAHEQSIHGELVDLWHALHQNPEPSMGEYQTADRVEALLRSTGADHVKRVGETGLWVELVGTAKRTGEERIVVLRGDMDALPIQEATGLPYASRTDGLMHACGHDVHTSALYGAVRILERYRDKIPGRVWFFFQPGEETMAGALTFLQDPDIDLKRAQAIAGIHVAGNVEAGKIRLRKGPVLASADKLTFQVHGRGGHAAYPDQCRDAVLASAHLITQLHGLVSREISPALPERIFPTIPTSCPARLSLSAPRAQAKRRLSATPLTFTPTREPCAQAHCCSAHLPWSFLG